MNNRIQDLAAQAGFTVARGLGLKDTVPKDVFIANTCVSNEVKKFAGLIIAECAKLCEPAAQPERPQNCGSGFCSCIECVMEPEQKPEPVGQLQEEAYGRGQVLWFKNLADRSLLYASPPKREWVELSKKQIKKLGDTPTLYSDYEAGRSSFEYLCPYKFAHAIDAKLKELNA